MDVTALVAAGLVGTAVLTALMYAAPLMGLPKLDMIGMMGTMVTARRGPAYTLGTVSHFVMGVILAAIYAGLWEFGWGEPAQGWGLLYGFVHGLIALASLPLMLRMHPRPPAMRMTVGLILGMIVGHLVYGLLVALMYGALAGTA